MTNHKFNISQYSDEELLTHYQSSGESQYIGALFNRHLPLFMGVSMKYLKNKEMAEDASIEVFEIISKDAQNASIQNFKAWAYTVCRHHCLHIKKKSQRQRDQLQRFKEESSSSFMEFEPENTHIEKQEKQLDRLDDCMKKLKEPQRICVELFYLKEYCYQDVSEHTGYEMKKVKSYIQNGKRNLKMCIES